MTPVSYARMIDLGYRTVSSTAFIQSVIFAPLSSMVRRPFSLCGGFMMVAEVKWLQRIKTSSAISFSTGSSSPPLVQPVLFSGQPVFVLSLGLISSLASFPGYSPLPSLLFQQKQSGFSPLRLPREHVQPYSHTVYFFATGQD